MSAIIKRLNIYLNQINQMETNSRKDDIIIEIGSEWLRMGLVGEKVPRKSLRAKSISKILKDP